MVKPADLSVSERSSRSKNKLKVCHHSLWPSLHPCTTRCPPPPFPPNLLEIFLLEAVQSQLRATFVWPAGGARGREGELGVGFTSLTCAQINSLSLFSTQTCQSTDRFTLSSALLCRKQTITDCQDYLLTLGSVNRASLYLRLMTIRCQVWRRSAGSVNGASLYLRLMTIHCPCI